MKKLFSIAATAIFLMVSLCSTADAQIVRIVPAILMNPGIGSTFTVQIEAVSVGGAAGLGGFQFNINYNPAIVTVANPGDVVMGPFLGSTGRTVNALGPVIDNTAGVITFGGWTNPSLTVGPSGTGILASITFTVQSGGSGLLNLNGVQLVDINGALFAIDYDEDMIIDALTSIRLERFDVEAGNRQVKLTWKTGDEKENVGFYVYRSESERGEKTRLNAEILPSKVGTGLGAAYSYTDSSVQNRTRYFYWLEDVDAKGVRVMHGPASSTPRLINIIKGNLK